ncbi:hypothetical protein R6Q57_006283 [Mikania cordata]
MELDTPSGGNTSHGYNTSTVMKVSRAKISGLIATKVLPALYCRQEFVNGAVPIFSYSSIYCKGIPHNGSPP